MVLSDAQIMVFFEEISQIVITHLTILQLQQGGIYNVDNVIGFYKEKLNKVTDDLKYTGGWLLGQNPGDISGATNPTPPFVFRENPQKRLLEACWILHYYETVGRWIAPYDIVWVKVINIFSENGRLLLTETKQIILKSQLYSRPWALSSGWRLLNISFSWYWSLNNSIVIYHKGRVYNTSSRSTFIYQPNPFYRSCICGMWYGCKIITWSLIVLWW